jgi:hypothetical protein
MMEFLHFYVPATKWQGHRYMWRYEISVTIPVSTFMIDLVFENSFLSAMASYVYSRDGRSLSIYGSECQICECMKSSFCPTFCLQVAISRALASFWRYPYLDQS